MCDWKEHCQGVSKWYTSVIPSENMYIYLYPSRYAKGWDITIYEFDEEVGFIFMKDESTSLKEIFAHAEHMVADFMSEEASRWERRRKMWLGTDCFIDDWEDE